MRSTTVKALNVKVEQKKVSTLQNTFTSSHPLRFNDSLTPSLLLAIPQRLKCTLTPVRRPDLSPVKTGSYRKFNGNLTVI